MQKKENMWSMLGSKDQRTLCYYCGIIKSVFNHFSVPNFSVVFLLATHDRYSNFHQEIGKMHKKKLGSQSKNAVDVAKDCKE